MGNDCNFRDPTMVGSRRSGDAVVGGKKKKLRGRKYNYSTYEGISSKAMNAYIYKIL